MGILTNFQAYCFIVLSIVLLTIYVMQYEVITTDNDDVDCTGNDIPKNGEGNLIIIRCQIKSYPPGSQAHVQAQMKLDKILSTKKREDDNFARIQTFLLENSKYTFLVKKGYNTTFRRSNCTMSLFEIYSKHCGQLSVYGFPHAQDIGRMCDEGLAEAKFTEACIQSCDIPPKDEYEY